MGAKNLKAVVVVGDRNVPLSGEKRLTPFIRKILPRIVVKTKGMNLLGIAVGVIGSEKIRDLPIRNWKQGEWKEAKKISGEWMLETILKKSYYYVSCPIGFGRDIKIE